MYKEIRNHAYRITLLFWITTINILVILCSWR